jgi:hypothetical protein
VGRASGKKGSGKGHQSAVQRDLSTLEAESPTSAAIARKGQAHDIVYAFRQLIPEALERLAKVLRDDDVAPREHIRLIDIILDRAYGKPVKTTLHAVVGSVPKGPQLEQEALKILKSRGVLDAQLPNADKRTIEERRNASKEPTGEGGHTPTPGRGVGGREPGTPQTKAPQIPKPTSKKTGRVSRTKASKRSK